MLNLRKIFASLNGVSFISLTSLTDVKLTGGKKNEQQGTITKRSVVNGYVFSNGNGNSYLNAVRKVVPNFELSSRRWGERLIGLPLVSHKEALYLEMIVQSVSKTEYFENGKLIKKEDIVGLPVHKVGKNGGIVIRDYKESSIESLRHNKEVFEK